MAVVFTGGNQPPNSGNNQPTNQCPNCSDPNCKGCNPNPIVSKSTTKQRINCGGCGQLKDCTTVTLKNGDTYELCDECLEEAEYVDSHPEEDAKIEIEEVWQPTPEDQKKLREGIHWETAFKNIVRKDITEQQALDAVNHLKELVGEDAFIEELFKYPDLAGQIGAKVFKKSVNWH